MISTGYMIDQATIEKQLTEKWGEDVRLDPVIFNMHPQGARLLVIREEADKEHGGIIVPDTVRLKNPPGAGYVIGVGPDVGQPGGVQYPFGVVCEHPSDLLGARIIFGMHTGSEFLTDITEGGYRTRFWMITGRDIWMIDNN